MSDRYSDGGGVSVMRDRSRVAFDLSFRVCGVYGVKFISVEDDGSEGRIFWSADVVMKLLDLCNLMDTGADLLIYCWNSFECDPSLDKMASRHVKRFLI